MKLSGKVAIITGSASGMGRASAVLFAQEGAKVIAADIVEEQGQKVVQSIRQQGGEAIFVRTDVSKAADVERMVNTAIDRYGRLDILFNNAGIWRAGKVVDEPEEEWDRVIAVNLKGVFLGCKYGIPHIIKAGGGSVINTSSTVAEHGIGGQAGSYHASKGGVSALTRCLALDYGSDHIRVNCILPGPIITGIGGSTEQQQQERLAAMNSSEAKARIKGRVPLGRSGSPAEIASVALFLATDDSSFITGASLYVDGGVWCGRM